MEAKRLLFFFLFFICIQFAKTQAQSFILKKDALEDFLTVTTNQKNKDDVNRWASYHKAGRLGEGFVFNGNRYVVYSVGFLEYWFGPYENKNTQQAALDKLENFRNSKALKEHKKYIFVRSQFVKKGEPVSLGDFPSLADGTPLMLVSKEDIDNVKARLEEDIKALKQFDTTSQIEDVEKAYEKLEELKENLFENLDNESKIAIQSLQEKYGKEKSDDKPGSAKKGNGLEGLFPVDYAFPKWFALTVDIITEILDKLSGGQLKDKIEKALTLAYTLFPDLVNRIASTLAKNFDKFTPESLDDVLNKASTIAEYVYEFYKDLEKLIDILKDPDFLDLLENLDLDEATKLLNKVGLDVEVCSKLPVPCDCISINKLKTIKSPDNNCVARAKEMIKDKALDEAVSLLEKAKLPVLKNMNLGALRDFAEDGDFNKFAREQADHLICPHVPERARGYCSKFIMEDSNVKEKFKQQMRRDGYGEDVIDDLANGRNENFGRNLLDNIAKEFGVTEETLDSLFGGDALGAIENHAEGLHRRGWTIKDQKKYVAQKIKNKDAAMNTFGNIVKATAEDSGYLRNLGMENNLQMRMDTSETNETNLSWLNWMKSRPYSPGEDGFIALVPPPKNGYKYYNPKRKVYFINGIQTTYPNAVKHSREIAHRLGEWVHLVYSKSRLNEEVPSLKYPHLALPVYRDNIGSFIEDLTDAGYANLMEAITYDSGNSLYESVKSDLESGVDVLLLAHSRGAGITFNVVQKLGADRSISRSDLNKLKVATFGGYCPSILSWNKNISYTPFINDGDFVPYLYLQLYSHPQRAGKFGLDPHDFKNYYDKVKLFKK